MHASDRKLLVVFLLLAVAIGFRVCFESTHFLSPDSRYYLEIAGHLASGKGFLMTEPVAREILIPVTVWPVGYPGLIAVVSFITGLSVLWASKLLNLLFLGGCFLLLRNINSGKAWLLSLVFCSYTLLEVFSYTWSEVPFLFFVLLFSVALHKCSYGNQKPGWWLALLAGSSGLFLSRYIGLFSVGVLGIAGLYLLIRKEAKKGIYLWLVAFVSGLLVLGYFYRNYVTDGHLSGDSREFEHHETFGHFIWILVRGLFNELMLFRHNYFKGKPDLLFWLTAIVQFLLLGFFYLKFVRNKLKIEVTKSRSYSQTFLLVALAYFLLLTGLRFFIPFDSFDFRILSPVSLLVYLAILQAFITAENQPETTKADKFLVVLFMLSLALNVLKPTFLAALLMQLR